MHASNYSQSNRRRLHKEESDAKNSQYLEPKSRLSQRPNSAENLSRQHDNQLLEEASGVSSTRSLTNINSDYYNLTFASDHMNDSMSNKKEAFIKDDTLSLKNGESNTISDTGMDSSYQSYLSIDRERRRSGSWTGVNESEDGE